MASTNTTIAPGIRHGPHLKNASSARHTAPPSKVATWTCPSRDASSAKANKVFEPSSRIPHSLPIWLPMMTTAAPFMNPSIAGLERKSAAMPSRSHAISSRIEPVRSERIIVSAAALPGSPAASGPIAAPTSSAIAASGPTIRCREVVNSAKTAIAPTAASKPAAGVLCASSA